MVRSSSMDEYGGISRMGSKDLIHTVERQEKINKKGGNCMEMFRKSLEKMELGELCQLEKNLMRDMKESCRNTEDYEMICNMLEEILDEICCKRFGCEVE